MSKRVYATTISGDTIGEKRKITRHTPWSAIYADAGKLLFPENRGRLVDHQLWYSFDIIPDGPRKDVWAYAGKMIKNTASARSAWLLLVKVLSNPDITRHLLSYLPMCTIDLLITALPLSFKGGARLPGMFYMSLFLGMTMHRRAYFDPCYKDNKYERITVLADISPMNTMHVYVPEARFERIKVMSPVPRREYVKHVIEAHIETRVCNCTFNQPSAQWMHDQRFLGRPIWHTVPWRFRIDKTVKENYLEVLVELHSTLNGKPVGVDENNELVYSQQALCNQIDNMQIALKLPPEENMLGNELFGYTYKKRINDLEHPNMERYVIAEGWVPHYYSWQYRMRMANSAKQERAWRIQWNYYRVYRVAKQCGPSTCDGARKYLVWERRESSAYTKNRYNEWAEIDRKLKTRDAIGCALQNSPWIAQQGKNVIHL